MSTTHTLNARVAAGWVIKLMQVVAVLEIAESKACLARGERRKILDAKANTDDVLDGLLRLTCGHVPVAPTRDQGDAA